MINVKTSRNVAAQILSHMGLRQQAATDYSDNPPKPRVRRKPLYGCAKEKIWIADDFDAPLSDFKGYMW